MSSLRYLIVFLLIGRVSTVELEDNAVTEVEDPTATNEGSTCDQRIGEIADMVADLHEYVFGGPENEALISGKHFYTPDTALSASSSYLDNHGPHCSRIGELRLTSCGTSSWHPTYEDPKPWIQVDLRQTFTIHAVATQGRGGCDRQHWTKSYRVASLHGTTFHYYMDQHRGGIKDFHGNFDCETVIRNSLLPTIVTRMLRLYPVQCQTSCAVRWELYGKPSY